MVIVMEKLRHILLYITLLYFTLVSWLLKVKYLKYLKYGRKEEPGTISLVSTTLRYLLLIFQLQGKSPSTPKVQAIPKPNLYGSGLAYFVHVGDYLV